MTRQIRIATRGSDLAIAQTKLVIAGLRSVDPNLNYVINSIVTTGDRLLDSNLTEIGGKGLFLKEIEQSLLLNESDIAVHSMKDVPVDLPDGLVIPSVLQRGDPRDALVSLNDYTLHTLPIGATVGTCSSRRATILLARRPDLQVIPIRGNVVSRINKLNTKQYDAILLACCGLQRLNIIPKPILNQANIDITSPTSTPIDVEVMIPAIGQGAIGLECRQKDDYILSLLSKINHKFSFLQTSIERDFMHYMGASCTTPIGAYAEEDEDGWNLITYFDHAGDHAKIQHFQGPANELAQRAAEYYKG